MRGSPTSPPTPSEEREQFFPSLRRWMTRIRNDMRRYAWTCLPGEPDSFVSNYYLDQKNEKLPFTTYFLSSCSFIFFHFPSFSFIFFYFLSFSFMFFHVLSCSFMFFHVLSFSFLFFPFLSFSFIFFHFLSFSFIFFDFVGCSKSDFFWASISLRFHLTILL